MKPALNPEDPGKHVAAVGIVRVRRLEHLDERRRDEVCRILRFAAPSRRERDHRADVALVERGERARVGPDAPDQLAVWVSLAHTLSSSPAVGV